MFASWIAGNRACEHAVALHEQALTRLVSLHCKCMLMLDWKMGWQTPAIA